MMVLPVSFCTLFDANYLVRGLVLIESLSRLSPGRNIWVLCMDRKTYYLLKRLAIPFVIPVPFERVNNAELRRVSGDRTPTELCWTCTPVVCEYVLRTDPQLSHVIYVDADVMFFGDPSSLLEELGDGSILIFGHGFPPHRRHIADEVGRFNVEVIVFRNDVNGRACVTWWRERCIEWCYHRVEPGRMGDQKYLDLWPALFQGVVVASEKVVGLAPWNFESYEFEINQGGQLLANGHPILFVHFAKLTMFSRGHYHLCNGYDIPPLVRRLAYDPYIAELDRQWDRITAIDPGFRSGLTKLPFRKRLRTTLGDLKRWMLKNPR
jgi:hypothetical protein